MVDAVEGSKKAQDGKSGHWDWRETVKTKTTAAIEADYHIAGDFLPRRWFSMEPKEVISGKPPAKMQVAVKIVFEVSNAIWSYWWRRMLAAGGLWSKKAPCPAADCKDMMADLHFILALKKGMAHAQSVPAEDVSIYDIKCVSKAQHIGDGDWVAIRRQLEQLRKKRQPSLCLEKAN